LGSYRTVRNAWHWELVSTIKHCELRCTLHCQLADTVSAIGYFVNSYFDGFKRINDRHMARGAWYNYLEVILKLEDTWKGKE
jgi:hypothetical protein